MGDRHRFREPLDRPQQYRQLGRSSPSEDGSSQASGNGERYHHDGPDRRRPRGKPQPDGGSHRDDELPGRLERRKACDGAFSFDWQAHQEPTLTDNRGRTVSLELDNLVPILQQKNGSVTRVNLSVVPALPGEPDFENTHVPQTPPRVEGSQIATTPPPPPQGDAAPGTPPLPRRERQIGVALGHGHLMTHFPKCNECDVCKQAKMFMASARRRDPDLRDQGREVR